MNRTFNQGVNMHASKSNPSDSNSHAKPTTGIRRMSDAELEAVSGAGVGRVRRNASASRRGRIPTRRGRR
jgi:hypothetical protein